MRLLITLIKVLIVIAITVEYSLGCFLWLHNTAEPQMWQVIFMMGGAIVVAIGGSSFIVMNNKRLE